MEQREMLSKVIRYQKAITDNAFTIISVFQNNGEQVLKTALDQQSWIPDKGKKNFLTWSNNYLQITTNMKAFFNKSYEEAERFFEQPTKTAPEQKSPPAREKAPDPLKNPEKKAASPENKQKAADKKPAAAQSKSSSSKQKEEKPQRKAPVRTSKKKEDVPKPNS